ncbi:hypothetical protein TGGT1_249780 [Toxoplasma gondii GT1]|uniref:Cyclic phosphodiesterase-like protein n=3 Tax=Toxoplasma gondii TaxID=5811 RepID=S7V0M9_TOXGG|nr:hypothetical protein TGGT1_249780 [Toxoplasma gondii GT1]KAF4638744.1 hypothetical protein TGRH88_063530 [Toxoplasma gondii]RQX70578.1 cyclic phosphodiesterase-like protein [Toxoplasma gondii CAST]
MAAASTASPPASRDVISLWLTVRLHPDAPLPSSPFSPSAPPSSSYPFFPARAVADLAECLDTPNFIPHITLLGGGFQHLSVEQITSLIEKAVGGARDEDADSAVPRRPKKVWKPFFVRVAEVESGDRPFQCIYARIRKPGEPAPSTRPSGSACGVSATPEASLASQESAKHAPEQPGIRDSPEDLFELHSTLREVLYDAFDLPYRGDNASYMPHVSLVYAETDQLSLERRATLAKLLNATAEEQETPEEAANRTLPGSKDADADLAPADTFLERFERARERFGKTIRGTFVSVSSIEVVQTSVGSCADAGRWRILASVPLCRDAFENV